MLADALLARFASADGGLASAPAGPDLVIAPLDSGDNIVPSGTSATIDLLLRLAASSGDTRYAAEAARIVTHMSGRFAAHPDNWAAAVVAVNRNQAVLDRGLAPPAAGVAAAAPPADPSGGFRIPDTADHVTATAVARTRSDRDEVTVTLEIDGGYHVNANPASLDFLIPTTVAFDPVSSTRVEYPSPVRFKPAFAAEALDVYEGLADVVAVFPKGTLNGARTIAGRVTVQACDDQVCLPPADLPFTVKVSDQ
jgi:hypothetical protein